MPRLSITEEQKISFVTARVELRFQNNFLNSPGNKLEDGMSGKETTKLATAF